jgi:hypothetical protein
MYLTNKCAISGKDIGINDNIVTFPYFDAYPSDFEFISSENIALRSEFEGWYSKNRVVKMVRDFWIREHHDTAYFSILAENENILIVKSKVEDNIRLFFLKYVFYGWFTEAAWKRLKDLVTVEKGSIKISEKTSFSWDVDVAKGSVTLQKMGREKDAIVTPITEWQNLQELLSANK